MRYNDTVSWWRGSANHFSYTLMACTLYYWNIHLEHTSGILKRQTDMEEKMENIRKPDLLLSVNLYSDYKREHWTLFKTQQYKTASLTFHLYWWIMYILFLIFLYTALHYILYCNICHLWLTFRKLLPSRWWHSRIELKTYTVTVLIYKYFCCIYAVLRIDRKKITFYWADFKFFNLLRLNTC